MHRASTVEPLKQLASATILNRWVAAAFGLWVLAHAAVLLLAGGRLPFDRPALAGLSFASQLATPTVVLIEIMVLMALVYALTYRRIVPDLAARAPDRAQAWRETSMVLGYAALAQAGGWALGWALGYRPFSFHLAGTLYGCTVPPSPGELATWTTYNFLAFAVVPFVWFRRRYSNEQLSLHSSNRRNDILVIAVVMVVETLFELSAFPAILQLSTGQLLIGAPITFAVYFLGTVLPTMVLIYCILIPRYLKLTGSPTATVLLGGLTYAATHLVEGWSSFATISDTALSLIFVVLGYFGPGAFKTFVTLRTGNAWVHAVGYHAIAPHVAVDTPLIVRILAIR
jgi:hypothetical protein